MIDNSFSKLRLFKITEFMATAFLLAVSRCWRSTWEEAEMPAPSVPSSFASGTEAITLVVLLTEFAMFRVAMSRSQVKLYCLQSLAVSVLAVFVAANQHIGELYVLAGLSFLLKVVIVPGIVMRLLRDTRVDLSGSNRFGVATMILIAIAISVFGFFVVSGLPVYAHSVPAARLSGWRWQ